MGKQPTHDVIIARGRERAAERLADAELEEQRTKGRPPTAASRKAATDELHWAKAVYGEWFVD